MHPLGSSTVTNVPLRWGMLVMGEAIHVWGTEYIRNLCNSFFEPKAALESKVDLERQKEDQRRTKYSHADIYNFNLLGKNVEHSSSS